MAYAVVLDTNVVLDLWHFDDAEARELRVLIEGGALQVLTSRALDDELKDVLSRAQFMASRETVERHWRAFALPMEVTTVAAWICRDPDDQKLLDLAASAPAAALITKDRALLALARRAAATLLIATPKQFLADRPDAAAGPG